MQEAVAVALHPSMEPRPRSRGDWKMYQLGVEKDYILQWSHGLAAVET